MSPSPLSFPLRLSVRSVDARVELEAEAILRRCQHELGLDGLPLPIPIEEWIERPLGYRFNISGQDELGEGVLGKAIPAEGELFVSEDLLEHEGRYRFTCAHELGHLVLHAKHVEAFRDSSLPVMKGEKEVEREADRFAAALLMPVKLLARELKAVWHEQGLSLEALPLLRGDDVLTIWLWRRCLIPALAERFGVSRAAMIYRVREVRLSGGKRLVKPTLVKMLAAPEWVVAKLGLSEIMLRRGLPGSA